MWRNDTACTDPKVAGDMLLPTFSKGTPEIPDEVYERVKELWDAECQMTEGTHRTLVFEQGSKKEANEFLGMGINTILTNDFNLVSQRIPR